MENSTLKISRRKKSGKGVSRRLRQEGLIPGVIYGREIEETISVSLELKALQEALGGQYRINTVLNMEVEGEKKGGILAMVHDYQFHPTTRKVIHVDFISVSTDREVEIEVPIRATGKSVGVRKGGLLMEICHELPVTCLPGKIPVEIVIDVTELDIGESYKVSDLVLPECVTPMIPPRRAVVSVTTVKEEKEIAPVAAEEAEEAAEEEGEKKPGAEAEKKEKKEEEKKPEEKKGK